MAYDFTPIDWKVNKIPMNADYLNRLENGLGYAIDRVNSNSMEIVWRNPDPTIGYFESQKILLETDDYDMLDFVFRMENTSKKMIIKRVIKGFGFDVDFNETLKEEEIKSNNIKMREVKYINDNIYSIGKCLTRDSNTSNAPDVNNKYLIPMYIIGYKTGLFD